MGNPSTEQSPEVLLYSSRQSGGFVNSAVSVKKEIIFKVVVFSSVDLNLSKHISDSKG